MLAREKIVDWAEYELIGGSTVKIARKKVIIINISTAHEVIQW